MTRAMKSSVTREGVRVGLVVAVATWAWLVAVDIFAGQPFRAFVALGGVVPVTALHVLLNIAYAMAIVALIHAAVREPSVMFALGFGFIMMEFAFAMLTVMLSHVLGDLAWIQIFGGSIIGALIALAMLGRKYSLAAQLHRAEKS